PVTLTFSEGTATLNGQAYVSGTPITAEGAYTFVLSDVAGNTIQVAFSIELDETNPPTPNPEVDFSSLTSLGIYAGSGLSVVLVLALVMKQILRRKK
ncbi:MAG: hypothetical protein FJ352_00350, partial [Firmicutes bacterium]|nr:hypothetical protein [Bacillota bacterium]